MSIIFIEKRDVFLNNTGITLVFAVIAFKINSCTFLNVILKLYYLFTNSK